MSEDINGGVERPVSGESAGGAHELGFWDKRTNDPPKGKNKYIGAPLEGVIKRSIYGKDGDIKPQIQIDKQVPTVGEPRQKHEPRDLEFAPYSREPPNRYWRGRDIDDTAEYKDDLFVWPGGGLYKAFDTRDHALLREYAPNTARWLGEQLTKGDRFGKAIEYNINLQDGTMQRMERNLAPALDKLFGGGVLGQEKPVPGPGYLEQLRTAINDNPELAVGIGGGLGVAGVGGLGYLANKLLRNKNKKQEVKTADDNEVAAYKPFSTSVQQLATPIWDTDNRPLDRLHAADHSVEYFGRPSRLRGFNPSNATGGGFLSGRDLSAYNSWKPGPLALELGKNDSRMHLVPSPPDYNGTIRANYIDPTATHHLGRYGSLKVDDGFIGDSAVVSPPHIISPISDAFEGVGLAHRPYLASDRKPVVLSADAPSYAAIDVLTRTLSDDARNTPGTGLSLGQPPAALRGTGLESASPYEKAMHADDSQWRAAFTPAELSQAGVDHYLPTIGKAQTPVQAQTGVGGNPAVNFSGGKLINSLGAGMLGSGVASLAGSLPIGPVGGLLAGRFTGQQINPNNKINAPLNNPNAVPQKPDVMQAAALGRNTFTSEVPGSNEFRQKLLGQLGVQKHDVDSPAATNLNRRFNNFPANMGVAKPAPSEPPAMVKSNSWRNAFAKTADDPSLNFSAAKPHLANAWDNLSSGKLNDAWKDVQTGASVAAQPFADAGVESGIKNFVNKNPELLWGAGGAALGGGLGLINGLVNRKRDKWKSITDALGGAVLGGAAGGLGRYAVGQFTSDTPKPPPPPPPQPSPQAAYEPAASRDKPIITKEDYDEFVNSWFPGSGGLLNRVKDTAAGAIGLPGYAGRKVLPSELRGGFFSTAQQSANQQAAERLQGNLEIATKLLPQGDQTRDTAERALQAARKDLDGIYDERNIIEPEYLKGLANRYKSTASALGDPKVVTSINSIMPDLKNEFSTPYGSLGGGAALHGVGPETAGAEHPFIKRITGEVLPLLNNIANKKHETRATNFWGGNNDQAATGGLVGPAGVTGGVITRPDAGNFDTANMPLPGVDETTNQIEAGNFARRLNYPGFWNTAVGGLGGRAALREIGKLTSAARGQGGFNAEYAKGLADPAVQKLSPEDFEKMYATKAHVPTGLTDRILTAAKNKIVTSMPFAPKNPFIFDSGGMLNLAANTGLSSDDIKILHTKGIKGLVETSGGVDKLKKLEDFLNGNTSTKIPVSGLDDLQTTLQRFDNSRTQPMGGKDTLVKNLGAIKDTLSKNLDFTKKYVTTVIDKDTNSPYSNKLKGPVFTADKPNDVLKTPPPTAITRMGGVVPEFKVDGHTYKINPHAEMPAPGSALTTVTPATGAAAYTFDNTPPITKYIRDMNLGNPIQELNSGAGAASSMDLKRPTEAVAPIEFRPGNFKYEPNMNITARQPLSVRTVPPIAPASSTAPSVATANDAVRTLHANEIGDLSKAIRAVESTGSPEALANLYKNNSKIRAVIDATGHSELSDTLRKFERAPNVNNTVNSKTLWHNNRHFNFVPGAPVRGTLNKLTGSGYTAGMLQSLLGALAANYAGVADPFIDRRSLGFTGSLPPGAPVGR